MSTYSGASPVNPNDPADGGGSLADVNAAITQYEQWQVENTQANDQLKSLAAELKGDGNNLMLAFITVMNAMYTAQDATVGEGGATLQTANQLTQYSTNAVNDINTIANEKDPGSPKALEAAQDLQIRLEQLQTWASEPSSQRPWLSDSASQAILTATQTTIPQLFGGSSIADLNPATIVADIQSWVNNPTPGSQYQPGDSFPIAPTPSDGVSGGQQMTDLLNGAGQVTTALSTSSSALGTVVSQDMSNLSQTLTTWEKLLQGLITTNAAPIHASAAS